MTARRSGLTFGLGALASLALAACVGAPAATIAPQAAPASLVAAPVAGMAVETPSPARRAAIRAILQDAVDKKVAPGFVTLIVTPGQGGTVRDVETMGQADIARGLPMTQDSVFRIFSMTKPVTAVAALILVEEGKLGLDDPVAKHIPAFAATPVWVSGETPETVRTVPATRPVTVRDLLRQTAGIPYRGADHPMQKLHAAAGIERTPGEPMPPGVTRPPARDLAELADRIAALPMGTQPGEGWIYGASLDVLGRVVEVASGQSLGDFMRASIFAPLGMTRTGFKVAPEDRARLVAGYFGVSGTPGGTPPFLPLRPLSEVGAGQLRLADDPATSIYARPGGLEYGGAGLVSTLDDYARFAAMLAGGGAVDGVRILKPETVAMMLSQQLEGTGRDRLTRYGLGYGFGMGVVEANAPGRPRVPKGLAFWSGAAGTFFYVDPATGRHGVIMTQVLGDDMRAYHAAVLDAIFGPEPGPP
jgi:CubicO group peptidase (beta-lactamase class C family)